MTDIRTKPSTPEYEAAWERVFGKEKLPCMKQSNVVLFLGENSRLYKISGDKIEEVMRG